MVLHRFFGLCLLTTIISAGLFNALGGEETVFLGIGLGFALIIQLLNPIGGRPGDPKHEAKLHPFAVLIMIVLVSLVALDWALAHIAINYVDNSSIVRGVLAWLAIAMIGSAVGITFSIISMTIYMAVLGLILFFGTGDSDYWSKVSVNLWYGDHGAFGYPLRVIFESLLLVLFFAVVMQVGGTANAVRNIVYRFASQWPKGRVYAVILEAPLTIPRGSLLASNMVRGSYTITHLTRAGFPKSVAAAVTSVTTVWRELIPPVLGVAGFMFAGLPGVSYQSALIGTLIPGLCFGISLLQVLRLDVRRYSIQSLPKGQKVSVSIKDWFQLTPLIIFLALMILPILRDIDLTTMILVAVAVASLSFVVVNPDGRKLSTWLAIATRYGLASAKLIVLAGFAGVLAGGIALSGSQLWFADTMNHLAGGSFIMIFIQMMVLCFILSNCLAPLAAYVLVVTLVSGVLADFSVPHLATNLVLMYGVMLSLLVPPLALVVRSLKPIVGQLTIRKRWSGLRVAFPGFLLCLMILLHAETFLLINFQPWLFLWVIFAFFIANHMIITALVGYDRGRLPPWQSALRVGLAVIIVIPLPVFSLIGISVASGLVVLSKRVDHPMG